MFFTEPKRNKDYPAKIIIVAIILSLIFGSIAGIGSAYLFFNNLDKFGFVLQNENGLKIEKVETEKITLMEEDSATIDVVKQSSPSVVSIIISKKLEDIYSSTGPMPFDYFDLGPFGFRFEQPGLPPEAGQQKREIGGGTGFIISKDGMILTNKHVVSDEEADYSVITNDGQRYEAEVLARDPINDLAVLQIKADNLIPLNLGDSDNIEIGQTVIAIGNALSEFRNTVTRGVISGIGRRVEAGDRLGRMEVIEQAIQTDAAINPGNSGGPLLNLSGQVIGINTAISSSGQLVGFAIPINEAKQVIDSIAKYGRIVRPFLGVRYVMVNDRIAANNSLEVDYGALIIGSNSEEIDAIVPDSPAEQAGLQEGDVILEVSGQQIDQQHSLGRVLAQHDPGEEVELKIWRDGQEQTVSTELIERPEEQ